MFNENRHTERYTLLKDKNEMLPVFSTFFKHFRQNFEQMISIKIHRVCEFHEN